MFDSWQKGISITTIIFATVTIIIITFVVAALFLLSLLFSLLFSLLLLQFGSGCVGKTRISGFGWTINKLFNSFVYREAERVAPVGASHHIERRRQRNLIHWILKSNISSNLVKSGQIWSNISPIIQLLNIGFWSNISPII